MQTEHPRHVYVTILDQTGTITHIDSVLPQLRNVAVIGTKIWQHVPATRASFRRVDTATEQFEAVTSAPIAGETIWFRSIWYPVRISPVVWVIAKTVILDPRFVHATDRQIEIVRALIVPGATAQAVAARLGLTRRTVDRHVAELKKQTGIQSTTDLLILADREFAPF